MSLITDITRAFISVLRQNSFLSIKPGQNTGFIFTITNITYLNGRINNIEAESRSLDI